MIIIASNDPNSKQKTAFFGANPPVFLCSPALRAKSLTYLPAYTYFYNRSVQFCFHTFFRDNKSAGCPSRDPLSCKVYSLKRNTAPNPANIQKRSFEHADRNSRIALQFDEAAFFLQVFRCLRHTLSVQAKNHLISTDTAGIHQCRPSNILKEAELEHTAPIPVAFFLQETDE